MPSHGKNHGVGFTAYSSFFFDFSLFSTDPMNHKFIWSSEKSKKKRSVWKTPPTDFFNRRPKKFVFGIILLDF